MRKFLALSVAASVLIGAAVATAAPIAVYTAATGSLKLTNDVVSPALFFDSVSTTAFSTNAALFPNVGGATLDTADLPRGFTYLNLPAGIYDFPGVVVPGTPITDLILASYANGLTAAPVPGTITAGVEIPEPATLAMAGLGLIGVVAAARRKA